VGGLVGGLVFGLWVGALWVGLVVGLVGGLQGAPAGITVAVSPGAVLVRDRATFRAVGLGSGLVVGLVFWYVVESRLGSGLVLVGGLVIGLVGGLAVGSSQAAWGRFTIARCWLALAGRLPWPLMDFLADAHQHHGVLRQTGPVYQLRHLDLQRRLAAQA
jgi:predicted lipid-binding transport protein (Tim44 family)